MVNRRELEGLVTIALREVRDAETRLERHYRRLDADDINGLRAFLNSLEQLESKAGEVEKLLSALEQPHQFTPMAA